MTIMTTMMTSMMMMTAPATTTKLAPGADAFPLVRQ
jgi:hypothetical protein